ncbi:MAG: hypothetical protein H6Q89_3285 [Myxococcaceae bacterium]|nr:hypothetical protein [Myxococcaceae bacterium]
MLTRLVQAVAVVAFVTVASSTFTSCGSGGTGGTGGGSGGGSGGGTGGGGADPELVCDAPADAGTTDAGSALGFTKVYQDIIVPSCQTSCHVVGAADGSDTYGNYATEVKAYEQVGKKSLYAGTDATLKVVDPNNLGTSTMFLKVLARAKSPSGKNIGGAMPLGMTALTAAQKKLLKDWICSGAKM